MLAGTLRISTRNARYQQWSALLSNRNKRLRSQRFLVQGVRPLNLALARKWPLEALLYAGDRNLSRWAESVLEQAGAGVQRVSLSSDLLTELGGKEESSPELIGVAIMPEDRLDRLRSGDDALNVVFDRPTMPGNIGTLVRSIDAFGGRGLIISGHAADPYDPQAVRASTGSMFAVPVVRVPSPDVVREWTARVRTQGVPLRVVGSDEHGESDLVETDLTGPVLLIVGNETAGMSAAWRDLCDEIVRIPIGGTSSSLNAAAAGTVLMYEAARQRGFPARGQP